MLVRCVNNKVGVSHKQTSDSPRPMKKQNTIELRMGETYEATEAHNGAKLLINGKTYRRDRFETV